MSEEKKRVESVMKDFELLKKKIANFENKHNCSFVQHEKDMKMDYAVVMYSDPE